MNLKDDPRLRYLALPDRYSRLWPAASPTPVDEERIREIVRKEIASLPIPFDVPDAPPET